MNHFYVLSIISFVFCAVFAVKGYRYRKKMHDDYFSKRGALTRGELVWTTKDGRVIPVKEMDHAHVFNTVSMLQEKANHSPWIEDSKVYKALVERLNHFEGKELVKQLPEGDFDHGQQ